MMINRWLRERGYIFVNNVNPDYLNLLIDLGSYPVITRIENNKRIPTIITKKSFNSKIKEKLFKCETCNISDIKELLLLYKYIKEGLCF